MPESSEPEVVDGDLSKVEAIKLNSNHLRGSIAAELDEQTPAFTEAAEQLLKFHGVYQQDDRDRRKEARKLGLDKHHQMMIRTRVPGGVAGAAGYLAHDQIAGRWGDGTMRVTTRQNFQLHGILKGDMRPAIRAINQTLLTTLGGCGDQVRNIMCCPVPVKDPLREEVLAILAGLVPALTPETRAYHEIWINGERVAGAAPEAEPLYGDRYLPRKFKVAVALEGDNCVDVYANDLALVAHRDSGDGGVDGFTVLVGGGMGRHRNKPQTFAAVAVPMAWVGPDQVIALSRAVVAVQRDHGDRQNRRHARLKYLIADRGVAWFRDQVQQRLGFPLCEPRSLVWPMVDDHLGWHDQGDGLLYLGIFVENGRIADQPNAPGGGHRLRTGLRRIVEEIAPQVVLTPQQNVILGGIRPALRGRVDELLAEHAIAPIERLSLAVRNSMACPAYPTCGLAVAESERALPDLIRAIDAVVEELGLGGEQISYRMTGCPNGCARPYQGDVGFVGTTLGKYDVFLGGDPQGTRLNHLYAAAVPLAELCSLLRGPLQAYRDERTEGESFGDWCTRAGVVELRRRFEIADPVAPKRVGAPTAVREPVLSPG